MTTRALQEAILLVLVALSRGSQHGSGIITDVREISGGRVKLRAGTLYAVLDRLRRYYRLIPARITATRPDPACGADLRVGDADREAAAAALGEHFAQGRLTLEELIARLDAALTATVQSDIAETTRDLPQL